MRGNNFATGRPAYGCFQNTRKEPIFGGRPGGHHHAKRAPAQPPSVREVLAATEKLAHNRLWGKTQRRQKNVGNLGGGLRRISKVKREMIIRRGEHPRGWLRGAVSHIFKKSRPRQRGIYTPIIFRSYATQFVSPTRVRRVSRNARRPKCTHEMYREHNSRRVTRARINTCRINALSCRRASRNPAGSDGAAGVSRATGKRDARVATAQPR